MMFRFLVCAALFAALPLGADNHGEVKYWSHEDLQALPADLQAVLDKAPKDRVPYSQGVSPRHLLDEREGAGHYMDVVHRERSGLAELHEVKTDLYVVLNGAGTVLVGGEIPGKREMSNRPGEWRGPGIDGGKKYALKPGDMINIPSKTPHQILLEDGKKITYLIIKIID